MDIAPLSLERRLVFVPCIENVLEIMIHYRTGWADHNIVLPRLPRSGAFMQATAKILHRWIGTSRVHQFDAIKIVLGKIPMSSQNYSSFPSERLELRETEREVSFVLGSTQILHI